MDTTDRHDSRYVVVLAAVAAAVLLGGWLLRPRDLPQSPPPVQSDADLAELGARTQRRSLENMAVYFADLANDLGASLGYVPSAGLSTLIWDHARTRFALTRSGEAGAAARTSPAEPVSAEF